MGLIATSFRVTTPNIKWALVTVANPDLTINREYKITAAEAAAVASSVRGRPPGCTQAEWESGLVTITTRPLQPGLCRVLTDGTLMVNYGVESRLGKIKSDILRIPSWDYEVRGQVVFIEETLAASIDKKSWQ